MSMVRIDPKSVERPFLPTAGMYGGGKNGCDVVFSRFECPAEERLPGYDRENENGPYAYFGFQVKGDDVDGLIFVDEWQKTARGTGSRAIPFLVGAGVAVSDDGDFDPDTVVPRNVIIEVGDPRKGKDGVWRTGHVLQVIAL